MSWLKNRTIGASLDKLRGSISPSKEFDPTACYDSFRKHWQQICDVFEATKTSEDSLKHDDLTRVVENLDFMVTLLILELRSNNPNSMHCLDHVLSENILNRLYNWSLHTGKYEHLLKYEQLKLFEVLVSHSHTQLLVHEPFHRPLFRLLSSCSDVCFSVEIEKLVVVLLNQLCVSLVHYNDLLALFFDNSSPDSPRFLIFSLLIPYVHREGSLGQQARDALLLCIGLSKRNYEIADFILNHSDVCPVLAAGLSGLYSRLPRKLDIESEDWYRLVPEDVNEVAELAHFISSLEFCNNVAQIAHPVIKSRLLDFIYQGFLVPVMGPALLQAAEHELLTATAYFELFLRSVAEPGLLCSFLKFVLKGTYDDHSVIECIVQRINASPRLSLVSMSLLETLIELNCEDVMVELVFKYLVPCGHLMVSHRAKVHSLDAKCESAEKFLQLCPNLPRTPSSGVDASFYADYNAYLGEAKSKIRACAAASCSWTYLYNGEHPPYSEGNATNLVEADPDRSLDGSSGYESFARVGEGFNESGSGNEADSFSNGTHEPVISLSTGFSSPTIGTFLELIFCKIENMLNSNLYVNIKLTGLVSRLAVYPQPLLRSFLLDHTLVFQPSIRSLLQVILSLKQRIDAEINEIPSNSLKQKVQESEALLQNRELSLISPKNVTTNSDKFIRGETKRSSFSFSLNAVFKKQYQQSSSKSTLQPLETGYRYVPRTPDEKSRNVVTCAIILTEWLKELAAIAHEHSIYRDLQDFEGLNVSFNALNS